MDPEVTHEPIQRIPDDWRRAYLQKPVSPKDVSELFDRQWNLQREKDRIEKSLIKARQDQSNANLKIWILIPLVGAQWALILVFLVYFLNHR